MTIDFDDRRLDTHDQKQLLALAERVVKETLSTDGITLKINIGLCLVDNQEIKTINHQFRKIDQATDVLSFPMTDYDIRTAPKSKLAGDMDFSTNELVLGDIVLSVERAHEQAIEYGHSFEREYGFLLVHGLLHLLGYDHSEEKDTLLMRSMEEKVLQNMELPRP